MSNGTNSIGGVSRIDYYNEEGQVAYTMDVPEELGNDPRVYAHDTAEPYAVLDNYDTSEQVLWNVVGYVENRMLALERAREMRDAVIELQDEIRAIKVVLDKINDKAFEHEDGDGLMAFKRSDKISHDDNAKMERAIIGGRARTWDLSYHDGRDCELGDMRCIYREEPYHTRSKLEVDLRAFSHKMDKFFNEYNWDIKRGKDGKLYASPPQELALPFNRISLEHLADDWNQTASFMNDCPKKYRFASEFGGHRDIKIPAFEPVPQILVSPK